MCVCVGGGGVKQGTDSLSLGSDCGSCLSGSCAKGQGVLVGKAFQSGLHMTENCLPSQMTGFNAYFTLLSLSKRNC